MDSALLLAGRACKLRLAISSDPDVDHGDSDGGVGKSMAEGGRARAGLIGQVPQPGVHSKFRPQCYRLDSRSREIEKPSYCHRLMMLLMAGSDALGRLFGPGYCAVVVATTDEKALPRL